MARHPLPARSAGRRLVDSAGSRRGRSVRRGGAAVLPNRGRRSHRRPRRGLITPPRSVDERGATTGRCRTAQRPPDSWFTVGKMDCGRIRNTCSKAGYHIQSVWQGQQNHDRPVALESPQVWHGRLVLSEADEQCESFESKAGRDAHGPVKKAAPSERIAETPSSPDSPEPVSPPETEPEQLSATEGERRQATVLFADLSGFTSMSEQLDPE